MTSAEISSGTDHSSGRYPVGARAFPHRDLLAISQLERHEILFLLDEAEQWVELNRGASKHRDLLAGLTVINAFFENSTRTLLSFEIAGKRLGADVVNMHAAQSSVKKGETLIDTAITLNSMRPDAIVIRHGSSGATALIADKVDCPVINAGDGQHEHPTQALLDAFTIREHKGRLEGLKVAIIGDLLHSRVLRSNVLLLNTMGADVWLCGPATLMPAGLDRFGVHSTTTIEEAVDGADVVMLLRIQQERMHGHFFPSIREYFTLFGMTPERLRLAKDDVIVMHPGPMNRGVEIDSAVADGPYSVILEQVSNGVAVRMAVLYLLAGREGNEVSNARAS
jgi:aspartate carbamoyltransferase catalytic subunit